MEIYGLGLVAICMFVGSTLGTLAGDLLGISGDVGSVGFAMLLLIIINNTMRDKGNNISAETERGISLLSSLYIPITVAMSARQDVVSAFKGGLIPLLAGTIATLGGLYLVPIISKLSELNIKTSTRDYLEVKHD